MSRRSYLPPRCPFPSHKPISPSSSNDHFTPRHQKSVSQSFILEEQPPWLDDILGDTYADSKEIPLRRSVSDSVTLLGSVVTDEYSCLNENSSGLESSCVYGPNSPRSKGTMASSENIVVSKLKDYFSPKQPYYPDSGVIESGIVRPRCASGSTEVANVETQTCRRHSGQRSRVRKLQYIAELERKVDSLQALESELGIKVAALLQHRVALSLENNTLKQQLAALKQEKVFAEGKYRSLKRELESLKNQLVMQNNNREFRPISVSEEVDPQAMWQMLDFMKLNINQ